MRHPAPSAPLEPRLARLGLGDEEVGIVTVSGVTSESSTACT